MDQIDEKLDYILDSNGLQSTPNEFVEKVLKAMGINKGYISYGPTRDTIKKIKH